jgi:hypothetical protein
MARTLTVCMTTAQDGGMATFRATLTIDIERLDGTTSSITETLTYHAGDNPRFDHSSSEEAAHRAMRAVLARFPAEQRMGARA